jgi:S1-C subfamily serine protease
LETCLSAISFSRFGCIMISRPALILASALLLSACAGTAPPVGVESRDFAITENAVPTSGAGSAAASVAHLLPRTGPTYVTLNVTEVDRFVGGDKGRKAAITSGSGYVVDGTGYVITAAHVAVEKGNAINAKAANGKVYSGKVVAINKANDMAIVKLRGFSGPAVIPAAPGCAARGDLVYTLGRPHAQGDTVRVGAFESRRFGRAVSYGKFGYPDAMVMRMGTQKGESGGPLFDGNGKLIGMVVSTLSDASGNSINLAHAIPSTALAKFYCESTNCSANWTAIANTELDDCSGA